jgi:phytase-like protein
MLRVDWPRLASTAAALTVVALAAAGTACSSKRGASAEWLARGGPPVTCAGTTPPELVLEQVLPIAITDDFQPSGLALYQNRLLTVSDRHDDAIYEIVRVDGAAASAGVATLRPFLRLRPPAHGPRPTDLEGIALDSDPNPNPDAGQAAVPMLLASEGRSRVLRVEPGGATAWITPALEEIARPLGMLRLDNAGLEGIVRLPNGRILLAAERDLRGLIELPTAGLPDDHARAPVDVQAWAMPNSICTPPPGRGNDFADLAVWNGQVFALERNSHVVMRIERTATEWVERGGWSYARTENDPRFAYADRSFGVAEGLALDDQHIFIVMDNNHDHLAADERDRRPRLFVFQHPP